MQQQEYIISTNRIEAFSDGVIAIIITLMVFDVKLPELKEDQLNLAALKPVVPKLMAFLFSFLMLSIFWVNHHQWCLLFILCRRQFKERTNENIKT